MGETLGDIELAMIVGSEFHRHMAAIGGRTFPDIHGDIQHRAHHDTDQFGLCIGRLLEMESAHHSIAGFRLVILHEVHIDAGLLLEVT